jgi:hypothetical protein
LSYVVEPGYLTFAEGIKIDDDAIFVQNDPFAMTQTLKNSWGIWEMRGLRAMILREKSLFTIRKCQEDIKNWRKISGEPLNSRYPVRSVSVTMPPVHFQAWPEPSMRTALPIIHPYQILFAQHESLFNKILAGLLISA